MMALPLIFDAIQSDIPAIKSLEAAAGLSPWSEADYQNMITGEGGDMLLVAKQNGHILGFLSVRLITKPRCVEQLDLPVGKSFRNRTENKTTEISEAEICNIAVEESKRRHRIGAKLLQEAVSRLFARGDYSIFLEVRQSNRPAIGFYLANGFEKVGLRKGYYSNPIEDAWIMELSSNLKS